MGWRPSSHASVPRAGRADRSHDPRWMGTATAARRVRHPSHPADAAAIRQPPPAPSVGIVGDDPTGRDVNGASCAGPCGGGGVRRPGGAGARPRDRHAGRSAGVLHGPQTREPARVPLARRAHGVVRRAHRPRHVPRDRGRQWHRCPPRGARRVAGGSGDRDDLGRCAGTRHRAPRRRGARAAPGGPGVAPPPVAGAHG